MDKTLIAMSGGVDSSVAALLMKKQGSDVIGVTMKLYDNEDINMAEEKTCCSLSDIEDARAVAHKLGFPYYVFNFKAEFKEKVIDNFINCYKCGLTPNPCIECNRYLKFKELYRRAEELGCDSIATGHYARIEYDNESGKYKLLKGVDESKDQSYVLYHMTQEQLSHTVFPLGEYTKEEIRAKAAEHGLLNANKRDSQDICFIPDGNYKKFIESYTGEKVGAGNFVDLDGNVIGKHFGYYRYTVGQRKSVVVSKPGKFYVCEVRPKTNEVVVGRESDLYHSELIAEDFNWISGESPVGEITVCGRCRYHQTSAKGTATALDDGRVKVVFDQPQRAITKGQSVVLYNGDEVLGGGIITEVDQ